MTCTVGGLLTVNQSTYPGLVTQPYFIQIWDGDVVICRVYGDGTHIHQTTAQKICNAINTGTPDDKNNCDLN